MAILAVDPGYDRCGVAVLEKGRSPRLLYSGCITTKRSDEFATRLSEVRREIAVLIQRWEPDALVLEKLYMKANTRSGLRVAEARGTILAEAGNLDIPVFEYAPAEVKVAITGYGRATKSQITAMVKKLVDCGSGKRLDDEYDAIAVGLTHLAMHREK